MTDFLSEARVIIGRYQQITSVDLTETSQIAQGSLDNVVEAYLGDGYMGLTVGANTAGTGVVVQPGLLSQGGKVYNLGSAFPVDLSSKIAMIPDATKTMVVLIVADGDESQTSETRTFEDASKKPTNAADLWPTVQTYVATRMVRSVDVSAVAGNADIQPAPPPVNAALMVLATVVLSVAGVVSVTQSTAGQITTQEQMAATLAAVSAYVDTLEDTVTGLLSSVSALALALTNLSAREQSDVASLQRQIDQLRITATTPAASTFTGQDLFLDLSQSLPTASGYNASVNGGLRFPAVKADIPVAAQNPYDGNLQQGTGTLIYPAVTGTASGTIGNTQYLEVGSQIPYRKFGTLAAVSLPVVRRGFGRSRIRSSIGLKATSPAQVLANGDPSQLFAIDPTTFVYDAADWGPWQTTTTEINRQNGYWNDLTSRDYWTPILGTGNTGGLPAASQPYQPATSKMLTSLRLVTNGVGNVNVRLLICADLNGKPDLTNTYADVSVLTANTNNVQANWPTFVMPAPVLLKGGRAYHFVFTADNANLGFFPSSVVTSSSTSSYLAYANNDWSIAAAGARIAMTLGFAQFSNPTITIPLAPLQLSGGGDTVDFQASLVLPDGCTIGYQVYIGGKWVPLAQVLNSTYPLAGNPSNVPCNLVLSGTSTVVPIIDTAFSTSRISKSAAALEHVSSIQTPVAPVTTIHKSLVVDNWNAAVHTLNAGLRTGPGFATPAVAPTSTKDTTQTDGSLLRTWTWTLGAAVPSFEMELDGATTDATQQFVGRRSNWDAAP